MEFVKTTENNGHYHIVYLREEDGITSEKHKHAHELELDPGREPGATTSGDAIVPIPPQWIVHEADGHTHDLEAVVIKDPAENRPKDEDIVAEARVLHSTSRAFEKEFRDNGVEAEGFYEGSKQWSEDAVAKLDTEDRTHLTLNQIESKIDLLSGYQRQNRFDIHYFPTEDGDSIVADMLTILVKNITEQSNFAYEETEAFEDGLIVGRGNLDVHVSFDDNLAGDIVIDHFPWDEVYYGPHIKKDLKDCEYKIKSKFVSWAKLKEMWPKKAEEITKEINQYASLDGKLPGGDLVVKDDQYEYNEATGGSIPVTLTHDSDLVDIAKKVYRVFDIQKKEYSQVFVLANVDDDFYFGAEGWSEADVNSVESIPGFTTIPRIKTEMRIIRVAGGVVLDYKLDEYFEKIFSTIPFYAKKRKSKIWGKVHAVKDAQRELNKRHSQLADILNKVAAYGWFYDSNTFPDDKAKRNFQQNSAKPGFTQEVSDSRQPPVQAEGVKFPSELVILITQAGDLIREIMNINADLLGLNSRALSGVAIIEKKRQGLVGNEFLFDNLSLTKRLLGRILVGLIQKIYSPERILRVLQSRNERTPFEVGGQGFEKYSDEQILTLLTETDLTKYDVVVGESDNNPTTRHGNFMIWMDAAGKGIPVPPELLVQLSDLPDKEKVLAAMQKLILEQQQVEQQKNAVEIEKTKIAAEAKKQGGGGQ